MFVLFMIIAVVPASEMVDKKCKVDDNCVGECSSGCYGSGQPDPECLQAKSKFANFNSDDVDKAKSCRDSCLEECNNRALIGRSHIHVNGTVPLKFFSLLQPSLCLMTGFANIMHYFACNYTFTMLGILREFRTKKGPKEAKRGTDGHQQLYSAG
ncbi:hypothetical protein Q3G72_030657 [Acer saccharum]|nr:hypothetical protein Q3G72_030657 [Acer saccharum]